MKGSLSAQRGMGYWGYVMLIIMIVLIGKLGYATIPAYLEDRVLDGVITEKLAQNKSDTGEQIVAKIQKQLNMDFSSTKVEDVLEVVQGSPGSVILKKDYKVTSNLVAHVYIVSSFEKEYRQ